jgi:hypothetical protein
LKEQLELELEKLCNKHSGELENIKKERAIAIDKLRKEMLFNIRNVKI